jgi:hypothetical protein
MKTHGHALLTPETKRDKIADQRLLGENYSSGIYPAACNCKVPVGGGFPISVEIKNAVGRHCRACPTAFLYADKYLG